MRRLLTIGLLLAAGSSLARTTLLAQGVTTGSIAGVVMQANRTPVVGASVIAVHEASGSRYGAITRADGRYAIPGMRVGGPYNVTVSHIGFETRTVRNVQVNLGVASDVNFTVAERAVEVAGIEVTATRDPIISSERTGASTTVTRDALASVPTITQRIETVTRLNPQSSGGMSFAGTDSRLNSITIDGSYFNNSFGLGSTPGDRTGVAPISLHALEEVQVSIAPFDVRQGNFVGASVNSVTRSGTNTLRGSVYYWFRDQDLVGTQAGANEFNPGTFDFTNIGGWVSGPIIENKLFFFLNYEHDGLTEPGTTFRANKGGETAAGSVTRVRATSLDSLSNFLRQNFNYETGPYQDYSHETPATRFLGKLDYNLNDRNKFTLRYNHLDSKTDVLESNSSSLGRLGSRRTNLNSLNFQNSNYQILENIRSIVGEWNAIIGERMANNMIVGYTYQDESRASRGQFFPLVDIEDGGVTYTSFGFEPFTPNNELRYKTAQLQNNFTVFGEKHSLTFGVSAERYESENVFFPGSQSVYVYSSLADWYTDANDHLRNPNRTASPVTLRRFQVRYANIPGQEKPIQPLEVFYGGVYAQDDFRPFENLRLTAGVRVDVPIFGETAFTNTDADQLTFRDEDGNSVKYETGKLPDAKPLFSPRLGFNWDARGDRTLQIRGGTGIFTGRPAYVWISNQIGNTGVLTGFEQIDNTRTRPFHPDPNHYKPANVTGAPAARYELALTDPDFKFPQVWRTNIGIDQKLPWDLVASGEFLYNRDVNGIYYINANLPAAQTRFNGADTRPRWTSNRIYSNVTNNIVMKNQDVGRSWTASGSLEKPFASGLFLKAAYSYGESKNTIDPGSIAAGSWNSNPHSSDPNNPGLGFSGNSAGHRFFVAGSYRKELFSFGATTVSFFGEKRTIGNTSYTYGGDLNGDGATNDLIYIPKDASEMNFQQFASGGVTYTPAAQAAAWEAFIQQDEYLSQHRGQYAERGAVFLPTVTRIDLTLMQDLFTDIGGQRNSIQFRADILNVGNLLSSDWGIGQRLVTTQPLTSPGVDAQGQARYRLRVVNNQLLTSSLQPTAGIGDVYRVQFSLTYKFN